MPLLLLALGLYGLHVLTNTWRWRLLLDAQGVIVPLKTLAASYLVAGFFNNFLPSNIGGDVVRVRDTARAAGSRTLATTVILVDRGLGLIGLVLLAALGATAAAMAAARAPAAALLGTAGAVPVPSRMAVGGVHRRGRRRGAGVARTGRPRPGAAAADNRAPRMDRREARDADLHSVAIPRAPSSHGDVFRRCARCPGPARALSPCRRDGAAPRRLRVAPRRHRADLLRCADDPGVGQRLRGAGGDVLPVLRPPGPADRGGRAPVACRDGGDDGLLSDRGVAYLARGGAHGGVSPELSQDPTQQTR